MLSVRHLSKAFGPVRAVDDLSFDAPSGCVTGFLGPNGAGKTTTLRVLLGLVKPDAGTALIGGAPYAGLPSPVTTVGAVLEATAFHPGRTARRHLDCLRVAAGLPAGQVGQVLAATDLADVAERRVGSFSLGMRQRLVLASALLGDPEVLVLDEPATGLDPEGVHWLRGFLRALVADGRTVLVSSHVLAEVAATADRVVVLAGGRLLAEGSLADLGGELEDVYLDLVRSLR